MEAALANGSANHATGAIPTRAVLVQAIDLLRTAGERAWPAYGAVLVLVSASVALTQRFASAEQIAKAEPMALASLAAAAILPGVAGAVATRAILRAPNIWRLDAGLAIYVAFEAAMALGWQRLLTLVPATPQAAAAAADLSPQTALTMAVGTMAMVLATLYWQLWPIGRVMGDRTMTPMRSVDQMVGAVWASLAASFLLVGSAAFVLAIFSAALAAAVKADAAAAAAILAVALTPAQILGLAATAAVWRLRNGADSPAAVFD